MYLDQDIGKHHEIYFTLVREFLDAVPSSAPTVADINNRILSGDIYKALKAAKKLITYEQELLDHVLRGQRVREGAATGAAQPA
jgi:flagellar biosynthesis repressor protein FlbT